MAKRLKANQAILDALESALRQAELENCGVHHVHQDAMRPFLNRWVVAPLRDAIRCMKGETSTGSLSHWSGS